jgi:phage/plasmid-like protein (TIGR03299 family)
MQLTNIYEFIFCLRKKITLNCTHNKAGNRAISERHNTMAHKIDNSKGFNAFVSFAQPAWHGLGQIMSDAVSTRDALEKGGLNFNVLKLPNIHLLPTGQEIISEDSFFTLREDVNKVLGSRLGRDYQVMQNAEALNIADEILQSGTATIETAGAIDEGRRVFICLKLTKEITVGSDDKIKQYLLICNSHDGSLAITAKFTNIRVVCNNTLSMALREGQGVKVRHTLNANSRLSEALKIMNMIKTNEDVNAEAYGRMAEQVISKEEMFNYFGNIFMNHAEIKEIQQGKKADQVLSTRKSNILADVLNFANIGTGQTMAMKGGNHTIWSAYNAVTGYVTRKKYSDIDDRAKSMLFGTGNDIIQTATDLAIAPQTIKPLNRQGLGGLNLN